MTTTYRYNRFALTTAVLLVIAISLAGYTQVMAKRGYDTSPIMLPTAQQADLIIVHKAERSLVLMRHGTPIAHYSISLGRNADTGPKQREGDKKTPQGRYVINSRNAHSRFSLSLHIAYPNRDDILRAKEGGYPPGENIMIHGVPNGWGWLTPLFQHIDWTDGCIAVSNSDIRKIWQKVPAGTPIEIEP
jgi:murein L,D-transpeptidase YafK